ncbi:MAG: 30S ribosomal protein S15 [Patescibacteria group bacterium]
MIATDKKTNIITEAGRHKTDTGSPEVQASVLTERIAELTAHLKINKKDFMARRGLLQMVGQRRKLLSYLAKENPESYIALSDKLKLRRR